MTCPWNGPPSSKTWCRDDFQQGGTTMSLCLAAATVAMMACPVPKVQASPAQRPIVQAQSSMRCGLPPLPPLGCRVGACVCDQTGSNCQWTFVCN